MVSSTAVRSPRVERRKSYDQRFADIDAALATQSARLHRRMDTQEQALTTVGSEVAGMRQELRKHMEDEEVTLSTVQEHIEEQFRTTVQEPLAPMLQLVEDTSGFVATTKRIGRVLIFVVKYILVPCSIVAGYLVSQGWVV